MDLMDQSVEDRSFQGEGWGARIRNIAAVFGMSLMAVGLYFAIRVFELVMKGLREPERMEDVLGRWTDLLHLQDWESTVFLINGGVAPLISLAVLGAGACFLVWIAFALLRIGATILRTTIGDFTEVRQMIKQMKALRASAKKMEPSAPSRPDSRTAP